MSRFHWLRRRTVVYNLAQRGGGNTTDKFSLWGMIKKIFRALRKAFIIVDVFVLTIIILAIWAASKIDIDHVAPLPSNMVLSLDLNGTYPETSATDEYMRLMGVDDGSISIDSLIDAINRAKDDVRVHALVVRVSGGSYDVAQIGQIRAAIKSFRAGGKAAYIYADAYGENGHGLGLYYLATAFDEIWMQPVGTMTISGINLEMPFFKNLMDKYGVEAQFFQRKEYKNAMEHLTASRMGDKSREANEGLVNELVSQLIEPIKSERKQIAANFDEILNLGLLTDAQAKEFGLIDKLDYEDNLFKMIADKFKNADVISVNEYADHGIVTNVASDLIAENNASYNVAVVHVNGIILDGAMDVSPYGMGESIASAADIEQSIRDAAYMPSIKTIILRINSPGGSPVASETIHRAVEWAKTVKNKRVVVSMGSVAASGGYWIASNADKIYANNATLTGSIGVVGGKVNLQNFWKKLDVNWDGVSYGKNAGLMSFNKPFSPSEQKQFEATLDSVYAAFIDRVAKGRGMSVIEAENVAKGHVWTGRQALKVKLVDEIGGMDKVLDDEAKRIGIAGRNNLKIMHLPAAPSLLEIAKQMLITGSSASIGMDNLQVLSALNIPHILVLDTTSFAVIK